MTSMSVPVKSAPLMVSVATPDPTSGNCGGNVDVIVGALADEMLGPVIANERRSARVSALSHQRKLYGASDSADRGPNPTPASPPSSMTTRPF